MRHLIYASKNKIPDFILFFNALLFFISFLTIICVPAIMAQFELPTIGNIKPTISLSADPMTPLPNSAVTVTANLSGIANGENSSYTWFINGAKQKEASGLNRNIFKLNAGNIGAIYKISVSIATLTGENLSDAINLTVSNVDLTWSANSQAPISYRAKLMPAQNSIVTISALPFIYIPGTKNLISSNALIYNWTINGKLDSEKSGLNKSAYILRVNNFFGNTYNIRLEVKTADGAVSLNKYATIPVVKPQIFLHFSDPKTGQPFGIALKNLTARSANFNFIAQAYFFTVPMKNLRWQWLVNNTEIDSKNKNAWFATLNLDNDFSGQLSAQIQAVAANPDNDLEIGQSIINLEIK